MSNYDPDLQKRKDTAAAAKKALLRKFQAAAEDPKITQRQAERVAINEARIVRRAEREAARLKSETELARAAKREAQARLETEKAVALLAAEQTEREAAVAAEKKAARDARYAARKAAKKVRRRGY